MNGRYHQNFHQYGYGQYLPVFPNQPMYPHQYQVQSPYSFHANNASHQRGKRKLDSTHHSQPKYAKSPQESGNKWLIIAQKLPDADPIMSRKAELSRAAAARISMQMKQYYNMNIQRDDVKEAKENIRSMLHKVLLSIFPFTEVFITGSSVTGFGFKRSDLDLCVVLTPKADMIDQKHDALVILNMLRHAYGKFKCVGNLEVVKAKVPILKFRDHFSNIDCDVNINNVVGIRNSFLLRGYAQYDWRIPILAVFVKRWAKCQNINDARTSSISSYSWALMVIHYLQCGAIPSVVPSLQEKHPDVFSEDIPLHLLRGVPQFDPTPSCNTDSLADLFMGFLDYYGNKFDYKKCVISVRLGKTIPMIDVMSRPEGDTSSWKCLSIEEPYNLTNTARSVHDTYTFQRVVGVIRKSYQELRKTQDLGSILFNPI